MCHEQKESHKASQTYIEAINKPKHKKRVTAHRITEGLRQASGGGTPLCLMHEMKY